MCFIIGHAQITVGKSCLFVGYIYIKKWKSTANLTLGYSAFFPFLTKERSENCNWKFTLAACTKRRTFIALHFSKDAVNVLQLLENRDFFYIEMTEHNVNMPKG